MSVSIIDSWPKRELVRIGHSKIAGTGAFAKRKIARGTRIIEYEGLRVPIDTILREIDRGDTTSTYVLRVSDTVVIDGGRGGNEARFFNHSCDANCEVLIMEERALIYASRDIHRGEELTFDYHLGNVTGKQRRTDAPCHCGAKNCTGSMLASKRRSQRTRTLIAS